MLTSGALALTGGYIPGIGECNYTVVGQVRTLNYSNACGSGDYKCVYTRPGGLLSAGYSWFFQSCSTAGQGVCCGLSNTLTCGYSYAIKSCGSCKTCDGNGTCGNNLPDGILCQENGSSGYCGQGNCALDTIAPYFINSQSNLYIKNIQDLKNYTFDVDFIDNVKLGNYTINACDENSAQYFANKSDILPAPIFEGNCALETFTLNGTGFGQNWKLSSEMWDWILERIANQGKVSISINLTDGVNNINNSGILFNIINDYTKPVVNVSNSINSIPGGNKVTITANSSDLFGETNTDIFIDNEKVLSNCTLTSCQVDRVYAEGIHNYYATATDPSGNNATSSTGTFSFIKVVPTCSDSLGQVCTNGTVCSQNTFKTSDTDNCCSTSCTTIIPTLPTCDGQGGLGFNPATDTCNGNEVAADGLASPLMCCVGTLQKIPQIERLEVSWTNKNGDLISSASIQDNVNCIASGLIGSGEMIVTKNGDEISRKNVTLPSTSPFIVSNIGTYECDLQIGDKTKAAVMTVIEAPASPIKTALPVFGLFNAITTLGIIFTYYIFEKSRNKKIK